MSLLKKLIATLRPFYDFRALILLALCFSIGMSGAALMLSKALMPYLRVSDHARSALDEGNIAAALVVLARTILVLGILALLVIWGK